MSDSTEIVKAEPKRISAYDDFRQQLSEREDEIVTMLPSNVSRDRFTNSTLAAIKQNPDLLDCEPRSLFAAITKSAQDGLVPDGREGVITKYGKDAQWNPMVFGLRKRARELDQMIIDAQVVYENDVFVWHQGDDPRIEHEPAKLGTDRGKMIGAYAIFKIENGPILHREVMDRLQIEVTRDQSKAKGSLMWTKFETEGWRKTAIRRGIKTVPVSDGLMRAVSRDDENFDFSQKVDTHIPSPPSPPPAPIAPPAPSAPAAPSAPVAPAPSAPAAPEAPKDAVGEIPAFLDRSKPVEPAPAPREIPVPQKGGKPTWVPWGKTFIAAIMASKDTAEIDEWRKLNSGHLMRCEQEAEKAYSSINKAIAKRAGEIATAPVAEPAEPVAVDDLRIELFNELEACATEAAVEDIRARGLAQLDDEDKEGWKQACANKSSEIFSGQKE